MSLGERIKEARKRANLSQEEVARQMGVGKSTFAGWEQDRREPPVAALAEIMSILGVDANFLLQDYMKNISVSVFSDDETELIENYRSLAAKEKQEVYYMVNGLAAKQRIDAELERSVQKEDTG